MAPAQKRQVFYDDVVEVPEGIKASYADQLYSLQDRIDLDDYFGTVEPETEEDMVPYMEQVLKKGYATDPSYLAKWIDNLKFLFAPILVGIEVVKVNGKITGEILDIASGRRIGEGVDKVFSIVTIVGLIIAALIAVKLFKKK